ncbi:MAG: tetratricopeptide repeat protein [Candidatus Gastranaerophilales bacterium]|nr:tetratricopeptide repeat protein [Candidatus Gastranaerophilales bacterium]
MKKNIDKLSSALKPIFKSFTENFQNIKKYFKKFSFKKGIYEVEYNKGIDAYQSANYHAAVKFYKKAINIAPEKAETYYNLGLTYLILNNFDKTELNFKKTIQLNPNDADAYYNLGLLFHRKGKFEEALNQFYKTIELKSEDPDNFYSIALILTDMKKFDEACEYINKAMDLSPSNTEYKFSLAMIYDKKSEISADAQDINQAIDTYVNALKLDPQNEDGNYRLAICYAKKGLWDECVNYCKKVLEINNNSAIAYNQYGLALFCREDFDNSIIMYRKALVIQPDFASAYYNIGNVYEKQGDFKAAVEAFKKYTELSSEKDITHLKEHIKALETSIKLKV